MHMVTRAQAAQLKHGDQTPGPRRLARARRAAEVQPVAAPTVVAVMSGKGGVGKTNLAVNLSLCLRARGLDVSLADLDVGLANADVLLDVQPRRSLRDVIAGRCELADVAEQTSSGIRFIAGSSGPEGLTQLNDIDRAKLADRLTALDGDMVILDCAAGIAPSVVTFARSADIVLVVTTPEPTALADAYAAVKTLFRAGYDGSVRVVVNMVQNRPEAKAVYGRLSRVCEKFLGYPIADAGYLLHDSCVESAVRRRSPFVVSSPRCPASVCVSAIAARLVTGRVEKEIRSSLFDRVVGLFS